MDNSISELRQDLVTGDWVVIATGRAHRPQEFAKTRHRIQESKKSCPFEALIEEPLSLYGFSGEKEGEWNVKVVSNKYPAFGKGVCALFHTIGPYQMTEGVGSHEVVVTRDHNRSIALMSVEEVELLVRAYQDRYLALRNADCVEYVSIFHNHGRDAGASIMHPHSQIIAIPVIPPEVARSLKGSADYYTANKECIHCVILKYELQDKKRLVYENEMFVVFAPFASKTAFELHLFPKKHNPNFELIVRNQRESLADAMCALFEKLYTGLKNPDYNFFLHTAPSTQSAEFDHYHWHIEVIPKTAIWAGFEIGTGIQISTLAPESAAEFLRNTK